MKEEEEGGGETDGTEGAITVGRGTLDRSLARTEREGNLVTRPYHYSSVQFDVIKQVRKVQQQQRRHHV